LDIFTTREIALGIWLIIILCVSLIVWEKARKDVFGIIRIACSKTLLIPFLILLIYSAILMALFSMTQIWQTAYVKVIVIWTLFAGVPMCFKAVVTDLKTGYFKKIIIDAFKFTVLVEYLTGLFTFSLIMELIMMPLVAFVVVFYTFLEYKEESAEVKKITLIILSMIGFVFLVFTLNVAIEEYSSLDSREVLVEFLIPVAFSIFYIPVTYLFMIYGKYDAIFAQMRIKGQIDNMVKEKRERKVILACGLSYKKLCRFEKNCIREMYSGMSENEFYELINKFKAV